MSHLTFVCPPDVAEALTAEVNKRAQHLELSRLDGAYAMGRSLRYALPHVLGTASNPDDADQAIASAYHSLLSLSGWPADDDHSALARGQRLVRGMCDRVRPLVERRVAIQRGVDTFPRHEDDHDGRGFARELRAGRGTDGFGGAGTR